MTYESALAGAWPAVAAVGRSELRRFGLSPEVVEDLVQEAAAVVMRRRPPFSESDDLAPYVRIVVRRLAYRWLRRQAREVVGVVPDRPVAHTVAELVEHRLRLRGTAKAFAELSTAERGRLSNYLTTDARPDDAREWARERKQIERIRLAMNRVAEGFAAAFGWVRAHARWFESMAPQMAGAAFALTGFVALLLPSVAGGGAPAAGEATVTSGRTPAAEAPVLVAGEQPKAAAASQVPSQPGSKARSRTPTSGSRQSEDVIRVPLATGDDAGWRKSDNPTGEALVCVKLRKTGEEKCVDMLVPVPRPALP